MGNNLSFSAFLGWSVSFIGIFSLWNYLFGRLQPKSKVHQVVFLSRELVACCLHIALTVPVYLITLLGEFGDYFTELGERHKKLSLERRMASSAREAYREMVANSQKDGVKPEKVSWFRRLDKGGKTNSTGPRGNPTVNYGGYPGPESGITTRCFCENCTKSRTWAGPY